MKPRDPAFYLTPTPALIGCVLIGCGLAGCGGGEPWERASVSGAVTVDGRPLEAGTITFVPADGVAGPKATAAVADGFYSLPIGHGPAAGPHRVEIRRRDPGLSRYDERAPATFAANPPAASPALPANYNTATTLSAEVLPPACSFNFYLQTAP